LFNTNVWLRENGWLRLEQENGRSEKDIRGVYGRLKGLVPSALRRRLRGRLPQKAQETLSTLDGGQEAIDWQRTRAYLFPMYCPLGGIEINLRGRQPQGIVKTGAEYEQLREAILTQLPQIVDPVTGKPVISRALRREDLYSGPFLEHTPDIVFFMTEDYDTGWNLGGDLVIPTPDSDFYRWSGFHSTHGVLIARGNGAIRPGTEIANAELMDLAPTLLYALGLPIPKDMDGQVLIQLFAPSAVSQNPPTFTDLVSAPLSAEHVLSDEEEGAMRRRLHGLGYL
jgi:predicted AlkP superfamily phosphohydrolase/phosphomutase